MKNLDQPHSSENNSVGEKGIAKASILSMCVLQHSHTRTTLRFVTVHTIGRNSGFSLLPNKQTCCHGWWAEE